MSMVRDYINGMVRAPKIADNVRITNLGNIITLCLIDKNNYQLHFLAKDFRSYDPWWELEYIGDAEKNRVISGSAEGSFYDYIDTLPKSKYYLVLHVGKFMPIIVFKQHVEDNSEKFEFWSLNNRADTEIRHKLTLVYAELDKIFDYVEKIKK